MEVIEQSPPIGKYTSYPKSGVCFNILAQLIGQPLLVFSYQ
jgi:hypothetical protein